MVMSYTLLDKCKKYNKTRMAEEIVDDKNEKRHHLDANSVPGDLDKCPKASCYGMYIFEFEGLIKWRAQQ